MINYKSNLPGLMKYIQTHMYTWLLETSPCKQDFLMLLSCIKPPHCSPHCNVRENQSNSSLVGGDSKQAERLGIRAIAFSSKVTKTDYSFRDLD